MNAQSGSTEDSTSDERWLGRWMVGVALVYLLLFANIVSVVLFPSRLTQLVPAFDAPVTSVAAQAGIDVYLIFGLDLFVIAVVLLWASRNPLQHVILFWLVLGLELVRGILDDLYLLLYRDYVVDELYYGFIVLHLVVIVTGILAYRTATREEGRW